MYGVKAVQPIKLEISSFKIVLESQLPEAECVKARYDQLVLMDKRRYKVAYNLQVYQKKIARHFNKKLKSQNLKKGDLVLKLVRKGIIDPRGKFRPN